MSLANSNYSNRRFICEFPNCTRAFSTSGHLSRHIKIHTGDKPHECLISNCSKRFSRKDSMMLHFHTHRKNLIQQNVSVVLKPFSKRLSSASYRKTSVNMNLDTSSNSRKSLSNCSSPDSNTTTLSGGNLSQEDSNSLLAFGNMPTLDTQPHVLQPQYYPQSNSQTLDIKSMPNDFIKYPSYNLDELIKIDPMELIPPVTIDNSVFIPQEYISNINTFDFSMGYQ